MHFMWDKLGQRREEIRPLEWGNDKLSGFLEDVRQQQFASFAKNIGNIPTKLIQIDACFARICENISHPKDVLGAILLIRSHSAFRAACSTAMGTQLPETFVLLRSTLEYAAYALHVNANPQLGEIWMRRHDNATAMREMKKAFLGVNVEKTVAKIDRKLLDTYKTLYEITIDLGGHPNIFGVASSAIFDKNDETQQLQIVYLHQNEEMVTHALMTLAQVGICSLSIFNCIFPERFEILGINAQLVNLKRYF